MSEYTSLNYEELLSVPDNAVIESGSMDIHPTEEPTLESFLTKDDMYYRFDEWVEKKTQFLFITGLSGSGKSTLGRKLASKYHAEHIELDVYGREFKRRHPEVEMLDSDSRKRMIIKGAMESVGDKQAVIEGAQVSSLEPEIAKTQSVIVLGAGFLTSSMRMAKRSLTDLEREKKFAGTDNEILLFLHGLFYSIPKNINNQRKYNKKIDSFRNAFTKESFENIYKSIL
jgi:adenylate kinase family enzyme